MLMSSADRVAHIDGQLNTIIVSNTRASSGGSKCPKVIKPSNHYECLLGFCFNNIFCACKFWLHLTVFLLPNSETEMMGDGFPLVLLLPVYLNSKRLLSTSCNKQGQRSSE